VHGNMNSKERKMSKNALNLQKCQKNALNPQLNYVHASSASLILIKFIENIKCAKD
jgi:hypothetical protein